MKKVLLSSVLLCSTTALVGCGQNSSDSASINQSQQSSEQAINTESTASNVAAPIAKKVPHKMEIHGDVRTDNYYWMRDDKREDPEILAHLDAENAFTDSELAHTTDLQQTLFDEMTGRMKKDDASVPYEKQGYWWYRRYEGEKEYPIYARKKGSIDAPEEILLDVNELAKDKSYFNVGGTTISTNNNILAYSSDSVSRRLYDIQFKDLTTGKLLDDKIENSSGNIVWANDNKTIFYIKKDPQTLLGYQVYRHKLGTEQSEDVLVYEEKDTTFYTWLGKTRDDQAIYIYHDATLTKGASIIDANNPDAAPAYFHPLEEKLEYDFEKLGDWYYIRTNYQASNFRLMKVKADKANDKANWQEVIPNRDSVYLEEMLLFSDYLVVFEKENGQTSVRVIDHKTGESKNIPFNDPVYVASAAYNATAFTKNLRLYYSSLTTPSATLEFDLSTLDKKVLKQDEVLGEFNSDDYKSERVFVTARDGQKVPVSIVYRKDKFKKDGTNPVYQYAYGSYGYTVEPRFSASRLSLLDRGFVFALSHIRGGQMMGRQWYDDGKMFNKMNTFTDFIDVSKALVEQKFAAKDKVFIAGGSAGGLLMGAVINMAPELYAGVGAHVPFVDVVTTMLDETIPLTTNEYDEWGNPNNKDSYDYMLSYSPYDHVEAKNYPNMLVTTGLHDSQVQYFEPMKWVAKLREKKTDSNKLLFHVNMEAGHGGSSGRFRRNKERALEYAFFMDLAGIRQ